jgi:hypothetical protein
MVKTEYYTWKYFVLKILIEKMEMEITIEYDYESKILVNFINTKSKKMMVIYNVMLRELNNIGIPYNSISIHNDYIEFDIKYDKNNVGDLHNIIHNVNNKYRNINKYTNVRMITKN